MTTTALSPLDAVRDVVLRKSGPLLAQVEEIRDTYLLVTGRSLDWSLAIWCLDQIRAERGEAR